MSAVSFNLNLGDKALKNGKIPIVVLVSWRGDKSESRRKGTEVSCFAEDWDEESRSIKPHIRGASKNNEIIKDSLKRARSIYEKSFENRQWDYKTWAKLYDANQSEVTLDTWALQYIDQFKQRGKYGSADRHMDTLNAIRKFLGKETIKFKDITDKTLEAFQAYQLAKGTKGVTNFVNMKTWYGEAITQELIPINVMPFRTDYKPVGYSFARVRKAKVVREEVTGRWIQRLGDYTDLVLNYKARTPGVERDMDLWYVSYFTMGTDLIDIGLMQIHDFENLFDKLKILWYYERHKTDGGGNGKPMIEEAMRIVWKYYKPENKYVFNWIFGEKGYDKDLETIEKRKGTKNSNMRRTYRKVSEELGLPGRFTWRSARYSSSTNASNMGGDTKDIQVLMDHSSVTTTEKYIRYANHDRMRGALNLLSKRKEIN